MTESTDVRLARIEEGMVGLRAEFREVRRDFEKYHSTLGKQVFSHQNDIVVMKRDRFWIFTICSFAFGSGLLALVEVLKR